MSKFKKIVKTLLENKYERPYTPDEIKAHYDDETYTYLMNDPCHKWRAETGIELIHKEPDKEEFDRIWKNWQLMTDEEKRKSDAKSIELFGVDNQTHHDQIEKLYLDEISQNVPVSAEKLQERLNMAHNALGLCKQTLDLMDLNNLSDTREGKFVDTIAHIINSYIKYISDPKY